MVVRVAQITDTHLFSSPQAELKGVVTYKSLDTVLTHLKADQNNYDFLTLTGDISQDESIDSYRNLAFLTERLNLNTVYIPGNHDCIENMHEVFDQFDYLADKDFVEQGSWLFIFLDSRMEGKVEGHLSHRELEKVRVALAETKQLYVAIFLHHNPINLDCSRTDQAMLTNASQLLELVSDNKKVKAIISGHVHQDYVEKRGELSFISTPSTCVQFKPSPTGVSIDDKAPGYRILEFGDKGEVDTVVRRIHL